MRRFLVVDDNVPFAENLAEILSDAGAEVDIATGGHAALTLIAATTYDLLISDMKMPAMGGAELVHRVRALDPDLPAIVVTAYTNDDDLTAARREGLLAVLPKPIPLHQIQALATRAKRGGLVAVVDDDAAFADNLSEVLRAHGYAAVTAASVLETERLGALRPFAALVDLRLPDGPDGAALVRLAEKYPGIPLVVVSAHDAGEPPRLATRVLHKPVPIQTLLGVLDELYAARHA